MSHSVSYVVCQKGPDFNRQSAADCVATPNDLKRLASEGGLWEAHFPDSKIEFLAELSGDITLLFLPDKYTRFAFSGDPVVIAKIAEFDQTLKSHAVNQRIMRCDESLLTNWEERAGELWFQSPTDIRNFLVWIPQQDSRHWHWL